MSNETAGLSRLAEIISYYYDVGRVEMPQFISSAHQRRHRKIMVRTNAGNFLAKTYRRDPYVLDALRFQHRLSDHLSSSGLPVAKIQRAKSGKRIVEVDNWALELQEFVEGDPMQVSSETLAVSAHALGRFHEVCRDFPRPERDARMWRFSEVPRETFGRLFDRAKEEGDEKQVTEYCNRIALFLKDAAEALNWEARSQFETGLIHGDWHGGNLIFKGEKLVAIVDLEFAGDGCYLEDLSYAISNLCIRTTMQEKRLAKRTEIMLEAYQRYRSLSFLEEAALYFAVGVKHIATVSYQLDLQDGIVASYRAPDWMERLSYQCEWLRSRAKAVRWEK